MGIWERGLVILPITLSPPYSPPPPTTPLPNAPKLSLYQGQLIYRANWRDPWGVMFFPLFFCQTTVGIYDTSQNGISRTNTYLFLNCRRNINLHLHKCPEKASICQVPGCKRIVKKKDMIVHFKEASTSHFALQSGEIKQTRGIIYYKVSCLFTNLKINKHALF